MTDWVKYDPKSESIVLVGPMLQKGWRIPAQAQGMPQIAVDGGIHHATAPVIWAGDGDSGFVPDNMPGFFKADQDVTDFSFCLKGIAAWEWKNVHAFGFSGGRRDHDLANLGEAHGLMKTRKNFTSVIFYDDADKPALHMLNGGSHTIDISGIFSVLCLEPATVSISGGCVYKTDKLLLQPLSGRGISNEGTGQVSIETDNPCLVVTV